MTPPTPPRALWREKGAPGRHLHEVHLEGRGRREGEVMPGVQAEDSASGPAGVLSSVTATATNGISWPLPSPSAQPSFQPERPSALSLPLRTTTVPSQIQYTSTVKRNSGQKKGQEKAQTDMTKYKLPCHSISHGMRLAQFKVRQPGSAEGLADCGAFQLGTPGPCG